MRIIQYWYANSVVVKDNRTKWSHLRLLFYRKKTDPSCESSGSITHETRCFCGLKTIYLSHRIDYSVNVRMANKYEVWGLKSTFCVSYKNFPQKWAFLSNGFHEVSWTFSNCTFLRNCLHGPVTSLQPSHIIIWIIGNVRVQLHLRQFPKKIRVENEWKARKKNTQKLKRVQNKYLTWCLKVTI